MDMNRLTEKSREALQSAQTMAVRHGHQEVDTPHLLSALLEAGDGLVPRLLVKLEVPLEPIRSALETEMGRRPRVSGSGAEAGKIYITQRLQQVLARAEDEAKRLKDDYVSIEHLVLALLEDGKDPAGQTLRQAGVDRLLEWVRKNEGLFAHFGS